jgi:hypothetical protein
MITNKFLFLVLFLVFSSLVKAQPKKLEMIFLSANKSQALLDYIDHMQEVRKYKKLSQNQIENCTPMGDGCFHPQLGFIEKSQMEKTQPKILSDEEIKLKTFNGVETSVVNCDKGYYFDIFCGKESGNKKFADVQVWFDISSSIRTVDYNKDPNFCERRNFLEKLNSKCKNKVDAYIYNTSLKQIGEVSSACMSYGSNDESKLITWIKNSNANRLLIITDVDEMSSEMRNFLDQSGAKLIGDGVKSFTAKDLSNYASEFSKNCQ